MSSPARMDPASRRDLVPLIGLLAAPLVLAVWTTVGFFLLMPLEGIASPGGPGESPMWLVYSALAILTFAWPVLLLWLTRGFQILNRVLMAALRRRRHRPLGRRGPSHLLAPARPSAGARRSHDADLHGSRPPRMALGGIPAALGECFPRPRWAGPDYLTATPR